MNPNAAAWSFVLQYSKEIDNISLKLFRQIVDGQDYGDIRQDFILRIVTRYEQLADYCDTHDIVDHRGLAIYWLKMQGMAARTTLGKRRAKLAHETPSTTRVIGGNECNFLDDIQGDFTDPLSLTLSEQFEAASEREYAGALIGALWGKASPEERLAMQSVLLEIPRDDLEERIGMSPKARNKHLKRLQPIVMALAA